MSVLPNDVRWLRRWLQFNFLTQKLAETLWQNFLFDLLVHENGSVESLLSFEGRENRAWSLKFVKNFLLLEQIVDLVIDLVKFVPFLLFNEVTSLC